MKTYHQYCPIAKAAEILCERWTLLVVRELLMGSCGFNDIRRGVPLLSPSVLSQRLRALEEMGIIHHQHSPGGKHGEYRLTAAGEELRPLVIMFGNWGQRWARSQMRRGDLDPAFLMWDMHRNIKTEHLPRGRTVISFEFTDVKMEMKYWWLVIENGEVDLCLEDPGYDVDLVVRTDLMTMTQVWMGDVPLVRARSAGQIKVLGPSPLIKSMADWLGLRRETTASISTTNGASVLYGTPTAYPR